jgi:acetolactate synthase I/II/III large subunit
LKASDAIAKLLISHKIETCFELVGGMITHLLDSFSESNHFNIISMHHEQAAAFAAEGVARYFCGRKVAVAMGTSGPGATNLTTGIGSCWFDSIPCLFITGQVNTHEQKGMRGIRQQGFQELEIVDVVSSITKYSAKVEDAATLLPVLHEAISVMLSGRHGPVLVDIPNNIQKMEILDSDADYWINKPLNIHKADDINQNDLLSLLSMCKSSTNPLVCIGGGVRWSPFLANWLKLLNEHHIPYVSTLMGHERTIVTNSYFNMIGSYGNREANWAVQNCDLLLVLGARLDVRQTGADTKDFARNAKIVQIDIDPNQLNNRVPADLNFCCAADDFLKAFQVSKSTFPNLDSKWIEQLQKLRNLSDRDEYSDWKISPSALIKALNKTMDGRKVDYVCDVGNHQMWAAQTLRINSDQAVHYSGGMGAMGFALPTAIGIAIASRSKVIVITGDGSLQINIQELDTIKRLNLDITIIVLNNFVLGMVKNFQDMYFNGRDQSTKRGYSSPSFTKIAEAYGIQALLLSDMKGINDTFRKIPEISEPILIEVMMEGATECRPRLAFGSKLDEQFPPLSNP